MGRRRVRHASLACMRTITAEESVRQIIAQCSYFIYTWVVMPGLFGSILTGLFYSIFTSMGFFKFAWIIYKWIITLNALFWGLLFWTSAGNRIIALLGEGYLASFLIFIRGMILPASLWAIIVQTCIILSMCLISVYRPVRCWSHHHKSHPTHGGQENQ